MVQLIDVTVTQNFDLDATANQIIEAAQDGLASAGEFVRAEAVQQTPIDTGALQASAKVTREGDDVIISFNTPYALKQHEELGYNHPNGGKAKYLEDPLNASVQEIENIIAERVDRKL